MKIKVKPLKPRNPLVAPAHFRRAGAHRPDSRCSRHRARHELRNELQRLQLSP